MACTWACDHDLGADRRAPPSVLVYVIDTLRADAIRPYAEDAPPTPAISDLAADAVLFENSYSHSSWTRPSILSLLTGLAPDQHGVHERKDRASAELELLSETLQARGYATGAIVTNPNVGSFYGFDQGWSHFEELFDYSKAGVRADSAEVTRRAIRWIDETEGPFFLFVLTTDPHRPYKPPPAFDVYRPAADDPPARTEREKLRRFVANMRGQYHGEVAFNDHSFGVLLEHLRERGLYDEMVIVLTSDHGEAFGEHGSHGHGRSLYEEVVRVPLIVRRPNEPEPGRRVAATAAGVDLLPLVLGAIDGEARGPLTPREEPIVYARLVLGKYAGEMALQRPWKWISGLPAKEPLPTVLHNLERDPRERANISQLAASQRKRLAAILSERRRTEVKFEPTSPEQPMPEDVRAALEALGYLDATPEDQ